MDARSLAMEMASIIMWQKGQKPDHYKQFWNNPPKADSNRNADSVLNYTEMDMLKEDEKSIDASSSIPLDDGLLVDFGAIEVIQCLIEHHNAIFTDAHETFWR
ncbi:uncharacterized Rho GTPase-activating protein At5g61530-like [Olea europaea var. sylvestris]|nr:uncharacterized Rho GTPase-activating protein At5g61530-like [Olea europaea var. sylvestris]